MCGEVGDLIKTLREGPVSRCSEEDSGTPGEQIIAVKDQTLTAPCCHDDKKAGLISNMFHQQKQMQECWGKRRNGDEGAQSDGWRSSALFCVGNSLV